MKLILSPKDNINKIELNEVETFALEGETLLVVFEDGGAEITRWCTCGITNPKPKRIGADRLRHDH